MVWIYSLTSVALVSLLSLLGAVTLIFNEAKLRRGLIYLVSHSAGALFGDVLIHILPEISRESGLTLSSSLLVLAGIAVFFVVEKIIHWRHCHLPISSEHPHPFALMNLFGDAIHNLIDGMMIAASYLAGIPLGLATTLAVISHEIPQEISDYGVLLHGNFSRSRALLFNFITSLTAIAGALLVLLINPFAFQLTRSLIPFAAGAFIYIAGTDLIPELHKETSPGKSLLQLLFFLMGAGIMLILRELS